MIGFDYGTSNCAMAHMVNDRPQMVRLGQHGSYMPSALYAPDRELIVNQLANLLSESLRSDFVKAKAGLLSRGREAIEELQLDGIDTNLSFGQFALERYLDDPGEGFYIKSPKSFLGSTGLLPPQIQFFEHVVAAMMAETKRHLDAQMGDEQTQVVIGRPINFQGHDAEKSNEQAIEVLTKAAKTVGFKHVEFQYEPVAAGFEYEAQLTSETMVLVVDIGGGTTDCSMLKMGPQNKTQINREQDLLGHAGKRIGGNDFDIQLALKQIMPNLGLGTFLKTGKPMPVSSYFDAVAINNVHAQSQFYSDENGRFLKELILDAQQPELVARLRDVYLNRSSHQLVHAAERTKIGLSSEEQIKLPLDFVATDLFQGIDRLAMLESTSRELQSIIELMKDAIAQAGVKPDVIFVTGGTAKSPVITQFIESEFGATPIAIGDHFGSVTAGLARWAQLIYR